MTEHNGWHYFSVKADIMWSVDQLQPACLQSTRRLCFNFG